MTIARETRKIKYIKRRGGGREPLRELPLHPRPTLIQRRSSSGTHPIKRQDAIKEGHVSPTRSQSPARTPTPRSQTTIMSSPKSSSVSPRMKRLLAHRVALGTASLRKSGHPGTAKKPPRMSRLRHTVTVSPSGKIKEYNEWTKQWSKSQQRAYWTNGVEKRWTKPPSYKGSSPSPIIKISPKAARLQPGWFPHVSKRTGQTYWYNPDLRASTYDMPLAT